MSELDEEARRVLDGEASEAERASVARRRRSDPELDRALRAVEALRRALGPRPAPPPDLVARVMREVIALPPRRRTWRDWLWRPIVLRFRLRPASAVLLVATLAVLLVAGWRVRDRRAAQATPTILAEERAERAVRFAVAAPTATRVEVAGDFNGWRAQPLERAGDGGWAITLPVAGGDWSYAFIVDGAWVEDPLAAAFRPDGFGGRNAVLRL